MDFDFEDDPFDPFVNPFITTPEEPMVDIDDILFGCGSSVNLAELSKALRQKYPKNNKIEYDIDINCILKSVHIYTNGSDVFIVLSHDVHIC